MKAMNFENFPECFGNEDWKVTFFHNEALNEVLSQQLSKDLVSEEFLQRRVTYALGLVDMAKRSSNSKQDIQLRLHCDTNEKISSLTEKFF